MTSISPFTVAMLLSIAAGATPSLAIAQAQPPATQPPAQTRPQVTFAPSGRATTELSVSGAGGSGARIVVDYGQPHASGREVMGALIPLDTVWRAGANRATQLTTDVALTIGGTRLPPGSYTLALWASRTAPKLVVNSRTRQWGIPYDPAGEIARIPMRVRTLAEPVESFTITLVPNATRPGAAATATPGTGTLVMSWGTMQFSVEFSAQP
jgi:hypothetical protein